MKNKKKEMKKNVLKWLLICFTFTLSLGSYAQNKTSETSVDEAKQSKVKYVNTMEEARKQAYRQKKLIFFNCYADWAGPCMAMDKFVFCDQEFANFLNKEFIPLIINMKTPEGKELAKEYKVESYATYLILDYKGNLVHRIKGGCMLPEFKDRVVPALKRKTSLAGAREKYESGKYGKKEVFNYLQALSIAREDSMFRKIGKEYMAMLNEKEYSDPKHKVLLKLNRDRKGDFYRYLVDHKADFEKSMGAKEINDYIAALFSSEILSFATGDTDYSSQVVDGLEAELNKAALPDTNLVRTVLQIGRLRGERQYYELLQYMDQQTPIFKQQAIIRPIIESSFRFDELTKEETKEVVEYLQKASKRVGGLYARRLQNLAALLQSAEKGIQFDHSSFGELLAKAAQQKKLIFVDCFTAWCGPCRGMANDVFTRKEVGEYFNTHFINAKINMEKGEGVELAKKYQVSAYPTLLFIDQKGEVVHRTVGAKSAGELLDIAREVLAK